MSTLVLTIDDSLANDLEAMASRSHKPLPEWATEQLAKLASNTPPSDSTAYSAEWHAAFGSITDASFDRPSRLSSREVECNWLSPSRTKKNLA